MTAYTKYINAIERVLDKRTGKGASDSNLISWLQHLKTRVWGNSPYMVGTLEGFIDAIKQTPINS